ncbi:MAG: hypothetical protein QMD22_07060 [archaeon]|nr:hypothetical protein [archaeon]
MKKKGEVTITVMLIVALVASMGFMSAMGTSEDSPEEISGEIYASVQVVTMEQAIVYRADSNVTGEVGTRADYNVDGGWLRIDEGAGNVCTGNAQGAQLVGVPAGGATCKIAVDYRYIDTIDITGGYAIFRLTAPDSGVDEDRIADRWGFDDSCTGELERTFTVYPNNRYVFTIYCERGDDSFTDSASIYT